MIAVIDLDNCISDEKWRREFINYGVSDPDKRYAAYHMLCGHDAPANLNIVHRLAQKFSIVVLTARPMAVQNETWEWLHRHKVPVQAMHMRPASNHMSSPELKKMQFDALPQAVQFAIDDRLDILEMYADAGVPICWRVAIHPPEVRVENAEQDSGPNPA